MHHMLCGPVNMVFVYIWVVLHMFTRWDRPAHFGGHKRVGQLVAWPLIDHYAATFWCSRPTAQRVCKVFCRVSVCKLLLPGCSIHNQILSTDALNMS